MPGDGIGPDISAATVEVVTATLARTGSAVHFDTAEIGFASLKANGTTFTDAAFAAARDADGVILGPVSHNECPRLIRDKPLAAEQVVGGAPYQIRASDLLADQVGAAVRRRTRPCRSGQQNELPMFAGT